MEERRLLGRERDSSEEWEEAKEDVPRPRPAERPLRAGYDLAGVGEVTPGDSLHLDVAEESEEEKVDYLMREEQLTPLIQFTGKEQTLKGMGSTMKGEYERQEQLDFVRNGQDSPRSMEDQPRIRYLKYGDRIRLCFSMHTVRFYLHSDGFASQRAYIQQGESVDGTSEIFIVVPRNYYDGLLSLKKRIANAKAREKEPKLDYLNEIYGEIRTNKEIYEQSIGKPIQYREPIQLVHEGTLQFLGVSKDVEHSDRELNPEKFKPEHEIEQLVKAGVKTDIMRVYSLKLRPYSSFTTHFLFVPSHEYQANGLILDQDSFFLAYVDNRILGKRSYLYFPIRDIDKVTVKALNAYMYQNMRTELTYEKISSDYLQTHLFRTLHTKGVWITHIEAPFFLCLDKVDSTSEHDDAGLNGLIVTTGEAMSQAFSLSFKEFDPTAPAISSNGLWIVAACRDNPGKIYLKHLHYDVWIKPLFANIVIRGNVNQNLINDGSMFTLIAESKEGFITIEESLIAKGTHKSELRVGRSELSSFSDYYSHFKVIQAKDDDLIRHLMFASLNKFLRGYDEQVIRKIYDFTPKAVHDTLNKVLKGLKNLCINSMPASLVPSLPYKVPNPDVQRLFLESKCIDTIGFLLLKLFPAGASGDYKQDPVKAKILGKLLLLVSIAVKNNKDNQVYTFNKVISTIQKYIGLHLAKNQEHKALLSVIENCEEILLDLSLEQIINQFVRELAVDQFESQMRKYDILKILTNFCVFKHKAIPETQNLLHNILFDTEKGKKIFLEFKFNEKMEMIFKVLDGDEACLTEEWENDELKLLVLNYFKYQLFLLADICFKNNRVIGSIKDLFPIESVIHNLEREEVPMSVKIGLTRVLTSLFESTENLMLTSKPKLQQLWDDAGIARGQVPKYMSLHELERMKDIIDIFLTDKLEADDPSLHYEYLRFLSFLIRCDFIIGNMESSKEWEGKLRNAYRLIYSAFRFSCKYLEMSHNDAAMEPSSHVDDKTRTMDDSEELPHFTGTKTTVSTEELDALPYFLKYPRNYLYIYNSVCSKGYYPESTQRHDRAIKELLQEEICNFMCEINMMIQDVYLAAFKSVFKAAYARSPVNCASECQEFIIQLMTREQRGTTHIPEVEDVLKFKDLMQLYAEYSREEEREEEDGLMKLLTKQLIGALDEQLESSILNAMIGYQLPKAEFIGHLHNLYLISDKSSRDKYFALSDLRPKMTDCLNQLASWLNVSDPKTIKQASIFLARWKEKLQILSDLFWVVPVEAKREEKPKHERDKDFSRMVVKSKAYLVILSFLKLSSKIKRDAANNVLQGNESLGLHAVTFSRELLSTIELCNQILTTLCRDSRKAKAAMLKHIQRITIIPPPSEEAREDKWFLFSELLSSDIELLVALTWRNNQIAYLKNQEVRYFEKLMGDLNSCICYCNIDQIFKIFENVLDETTNEKLYNLILSYLWVNKKRIHIGEILEFNSETSVKVLQKTLQLLKGTLLMGKSEKLRKAKQKLREIFYIEFLPIAFPKLKHIFLDKENTLVLELLKLILANYSEMYLREKEWNTHVYLKFSSFFIDQDTALKNEEILTVGQLELVSAVYECYSNFKHWVKKTKRAGKSEREFSRESLFTEKLSEIINNLRHKYGEQDPLVAECYRLFSKNHELQAHLLAREPVEVEVVEEVKELRLHDYLNETKSAIATNPEIRQQLHEEFEGFCKKLLILIDGEEGEQNLEFVAKLINYIEISGSSTWINTHTIKYLLTAFINVIGMAGEGGDEKKQKKILRTLDSLRMTKTLLNLLCAESSEGLTSIVPLLLKLANKMLTGAIREIQDQFYYEFASNVMSERFFELMDSIISRNIFVYHNHYRRFGMESRETKRWKAKIDVQAQVMKLVQALCENHHDELQEYMVQQEKSRNPHNMIRVIVSYLDVLITEIVRNVPYRRERLAFENAEEKELKALRVKLSYKHAILAFKALTELVQGPCLSNQDEIANSPFFKIAEEILDIKFLFEDPDALVEMEQLLDNFQLGMLKKECATLLLSLMEQRVGKDILVTKMRQTLTEQSILYNIHFVYFAFKKEADGVFTEELLFDPMEKKREELPSINILELGFTLLFIIKKWFETSDNLESTLEKDLSELKDHCVRNVNEDLMLNSATTFFKDLVFGFVSLCKKAVMKVEIKRSEFEEVRREERFQRDALNFFNRTTGVIEIVRNNKTETVCFPILPYSEVLQEDQKTAWLRKMPVGKPRAKLDYLTTNSLSFLQELKNEYLFSFIFRYYPVVGALTKQIPMWKTLAFYLTIIVNLIIVFSYKKEGMGYDHTIDSPTLFYAASVDGTKTMLAVFGAFLTLCSAIIVTSFLFRFTLSTYYHLQLELEQKPSADDSGESSIQKAKIGFRLIWSIVTNIDLLNNLAHLVFALLGCIIHPLFFCFHILSVGFRSKRLQAVLEAIIGPIESILLTLFLYVVASYMFTVIGYIMFPEKYPNYTCHSLFNCLLFNIDSAFKTDGGTVGYLSPIFTENSDETVDIDYFRLFYDFLYNFVLLIIIVQLLGGLIVDKFRSLRAEEERTEEDLQSFCVICSDSSENIERRSGKSFLDHTTSVHNIWLYILFIGYLLRKPKLEFTGIESYVYYNFKKMHINWLPYSLWELKADDSEGENLQAKLKSVHSRVLKKKEEIPPDQAPNH